MTEESGRSTICIMKSMRSESDRDQDNLVRTSLTKHTYVECSSSFLLGYGYVVQTFHTTHSYCLVVVETALLTVRKIGEHQYRGIIVLVCVQ